MKVAKPSWPRFGRSQVQEMLWKTSLSASARWSCMGGNQVCNSDFQKKVIDNVEICFYNFYGSMGGNRFTQVGKCCLWWAIWTSRVLNKYGIRNQFQAGSCWWPRSYDEEDENYQYGYEYVPQQNDLEDILSGNLPELHCWCVTENLSIVDPTTQFFVENARELGLGWPGPMPPKFSGGMSGRFPKAFHTKHTRKQS